MRCFLHNARSSSPRQPMAASIVRPLFCFLFSIFCFSSASAQDRFPPPEFRSGYTIPTDTYPAPAARLWDIADSTLLVLALALAAYFALYKRSRRGMLLLGIFAVAYFGFVRKGCVCPIGSIQNVTQALFTGNAIPWTVALFFALPLVVAVFAGRVFCSSVCPLGAIQDLFVWRPWQVPAWLEVSLGLFAYLYLGLAVLYAAVSGPYVICQYDPFVSMFRLAGPGYMFAIGGLLLLLGLFVGRPYCRFLCPYGVLLRLLSPFSLKKVRITPDQCISCRLCEKSCPFGAIRLPSHQPKALPMFAGKRALIAAILLSPLILAAFSGLGYLSADLLSLLHRDIQFAQEVSAHEQGTLLSAPSAALEAFLASGQTSDAIQTVAANLRHQFHIGATLVGLWMGLVISAKIIALSTRRNRADYTADPGTCLACARCFEDCPVELQRRGVILELPVITEPRP